MQLYDVPSGLRLGTIWKSKLEHSIIMHVALRALKTRPSKYLPTLQTNGVGNETAIASHLSEVFGALRLNSLCTGYSIP